MDWHSGALSSAYVIETGVFFFPVSGYTSVWGKATAALDEDDPLKPCDAMAIQATIANGPGTGLLVRTFKLQALSSGYAMLPFHTGFHLTMWGRREATPWNPALGGLPFTTFGPRIRRPRTVRIWRGFVKV